MRNRSLCCGHVGGIEGFSLLEVLVALVIATIVISASLSTIVFLQRESVVGNLRIKSSEYLLNLDSLAFISDNVSGKESVPCKINLSNGQTVKCRLSTNPTFTQNGAVGVNGEVEWTYGRLRGETSSAFYSAE